MRGRAALLGMGFATLLSALAAGERDAQACGGCFAPTENPTVVTDHRMILSISKTESTLYDQIAYQGEPASFAWVLPFSGEITVGLSADIVFGAVDQLTQTVVLPPPGCVPSAASGASSSGSSGSGGGNANDSSGVTVIKQEVVGPYETVQLQATDPKALESWLQANGFVIPPDVAPVIGTYVGEHFNFLALKLVPNKGIQDMRPVRVTTKGANIALPLRMVAAGTGATVGISLWVLGEGRYEPQNFGSFIVDDNDLGWDVSAGRSNYTDVRTRLTAQGGGKVWEIESAIFLQRPQLESIVKYGGSSVGGQPAPTTDEERAAIDYLPVKDAQGNVLESAVAVRQKDMNTLFGDRPVTRVTRMRADLAHAALDQDLVLRASADQSFFSNVRQLTRCGLPSDPNSTIIHPGDPTPGQPSTTGSSGSGSASTFTCTAGPTRNGTWLSLGASFAAVAIARAVRRRKKNGA